MCIYEDVGEKCMKCDAHITKKSEIKKRFSDLLTVTKNSAFLNTA
jgi:hypothetical protein